MSLYIIYIGISLYSIMDRVKWTIYVTPEERDAIEYFCTFHDMDISKPQVAGQKTQPEACTVADQDISGVSPVELEAEQVLQGPVQNECPHCFQGPCITDEQWRQLWWPKDSSMPHLSNSQKRKKIYRKFYSLLYNEGTWKDPRYLRRKQEALRRDKGRKKMYNWHRRELMPNCVLKCVRGWLPNPEGVPYMDHYWE